MYVQDLMIFNMMIVGFTLFYHILLYVHLEFFPNWLNHCFKCRKKTTRRRSADAAPRLPPTTKGQMHPRQGPSTSKPWNQWFTKKNMKKQRFSSTSSKIMDLDNFWLWFRCWCTQIHGFLLHAAAQHQAPIAARAAVLEGQVGDQLKPWGFWSILIKKAWGETGESSLCKWRVLMRRSAIQ